MNNSTRAIIIHLLCGIAFLALPYIFAPNGFLQILEIATNPHERSNFLSYLLMLGFFYLNYYVLIPKLYFCKKYILYAISTLLCISAVLLLLVSIDRQDLFSRRSAPPELPPMEFKTDHRASAPSPNLPPPAEQKKPPFGFELSHALFLFLVGIFV